MGGGKRADRAGGRVLVGGIGYRNLRDYSLGVVVTDALEGCLFPEEVAVEDISYNPIAVMQRLEEEPVERRFGRAVVVGAVPRGRAAGQVTCYRWDGVLPDAELIQRAVTEGVTGIIALDNTLVVLGHFGILPAEVAVVEVEPHLHEFGDEMSAAVAGVLPRVCELVTRLATDVTVAAGLPLAPLGGVCARAAAGGTEVSP